MNEKLIYVTATRHSSNATIKLAPHPLDPSRGGALVLEVVWGARKRDRTKILLSAPLYQYLSQGEEGLEEKLRKGVNVRLELREGKPFPKLLFAEKNGSIESVLLLLEVSGGFRGGFWFEERPREPFAAAVAGAAWGEGGLYLFRLKPGERIVVRYSGRLYGAPKYTVIANLNNSIKVAEVDDLSELE